jgi:hypothetical protein
MYTVPARPIPTANPTANWNSRSFRAATAAGFSGRTQGAGPQRPAWAGWHSPATVTSANAPM